MTARSSRLPERAETSEKYAKSIFFHEFPGKLSRSWGRWHARSAKSLRLPKKAVTEDHNSGTTQLVVLPGPWISIPKNPSRQITSSDTTCALIDDMMAVPCPMYGRCKI